MRDLIFIGGAKGVGKSTVVNRLKEITKIESVNTGDIYANAKRNNIDPEEEIARFLMGSYRGLVDTHYTGGYCDGHFPRGLSREALLDIIELKSIDLIMLDIDEETLFNRRCANKEDKYCNKELIHLECASSRHYFEQYCKDLLMSGLLINNIDLNQTVELIMRRIRC